MITNNEGYIESLGNSHIQNFNKNWKFYLGDQPGAMSPNFDDKRWQDISLPHDYSLNQDYSPYFEAESAYKPGGVGNYRKHFTIGDIDLENKRVYLYFDGVYHKATTYINGHKLGFNPYGYTPFAYDLTDYLNSEENLLAVHVNHQVPSSRWYSGSGIYRDVEILVKNKVHMDIYGPQIDYELDGNKAKVNIKSEVINHYEEDKVFFLVYKIYHKGELVKEYKNIYQLVNANSSYIDEASYDLENISLWDVEDPNLYEVISEVHIKDSIVDQHKSEIGFRTFTKNPKIGISLNGKNIKLKGVCLHHDQGALGAADYYEAIKRQVEILKDMGANTIRLSHNPASRHMIDVCNKLGMLLVNEIYDGWILDKNNNYNDFSVYFEQKIGESELLNVNPDMTFAEYSLKEIIKRDYNAPAIFMTSIGNEILEGTDWSAIGRYPEVASNLIKWIKEIDPNRWLTIGDNIIRYEYRDELVEIDQLISDANGVVGLNYVNDDRYNHIHEKHPDWVLWASETASTINSRSVYDRFELDYLPEDRKLSSYDISKVGWGRHASDAWYDIITRDYVAGEAVWTGFDYLGEPTPFNGVDRGPVDGWPSPRSSYFGIIDMAGFPKDTYYLYRALWNETDTTVHLLPSWNEEEIIIKDGLVRVNCFTNANKIDLIHIDEEGEVTSFGKQAFDINNTPAGHTYRTMANKEYGSSLYMEWYIPYKAGTIKAIAYDDHNRIISQTKGRSEIKTTSNPYKLVATTNKDTIKNDGYDLAYITIDITDQGESLITNAVNEIKVEVSQNGKLLALDNGFQNDHDSFKVNRKKAFGGKALAIIAAKSATDPIKVTITSDNLIADELAINVSEAEYQPNMVKANQVKDEVLDKGPYKLMNYSTHTFPHIYPILPEKLELITRKGKTTGIYVDVEWEDIPKEELTEEGMIFVRARAYYENEELEAMAFIRCEGEKDMLNTDIAPLALIKEREENIITLGFATQQLFGELRIKNFTSENINIYSSETKSKTKGEKIDYRFRKTSDEAIFEFEPTNATYMTIEFEKSAPNIEDISLYSIKKLAKINSSTDFDSLRINDYDLSPAELSKDEFVWDKNIDSIFLKTTGNAAYTKIETKKKIVYLLESEDSMHRRKFTIRKGSN